MITNTVKKYIMANKEGNDIPGYKVQKPRPSCETCRFVEGNMCTNSENELAAIELSKKNKMDYIVLNVWSSGICPKYKPM